MSTATARANGHAPAAAPSPSIPATRRLIAAESVRHALDHYEWAVAGGADIRRRMGDDRAVEAAEDSTLHVDEASEVAVIRAAMNLARLEKGVAVWAEESVYPPAVVVHRGRAYAVAPDPDKRNGRIGERHKVGTQVMHLYPIAPDAFIDLDAVGEGDDGPRIFDDVRVQEGPTPGDDDHRCRSTAEFAVLMVARSIGAEETMRRLGSFRGDDRIDLGPVVVDGSKLTGIQKAEASVGPCASSYEVGGIQLEFGELCKLGLFDPAMVETVNGWLVANGREAVEPDEPPDYEALAQPSAEVPPAPAPGPARAVPAPTDEDTEAESHRSRRGPREAGRRTLTVYQREYDQWRISRRGLKVADVVADLLQEYDASDDHMAVYEDDRLVAAVRWDADGKAAPVIFED